MINLAFKDCCMECGNVDVDYDCACERIGDEKAVFIYCTHMRVCEQYKKQDDEKVE